MTLLTKNDKHFQASVGIVFILLLLFVAMAYYFNHSISNNSNINVDQIYDAPHWLSENGSLKEKNTSAYEEAIPEGSISTLFKRYDQTLDSPFYPYWSPLVDQIQEKASSISSNADSSRTDDRYAHSNKP